MYIGCIGCDGERTNFSNPRGPEEQEIMLKIRKGKNSIEELRVSSYLVLMASKIVHRISWNQLVKIKGENSSRAPRIPNLNEMVKMRGKNYFYVTICVVQEKYCCLNSFFKNVFTFLIKLME